MRIRPAVAVLLVAFLRCRYSRRGSSGDSQQRIDGRVTAISPSRAFGIGTTAGPRYPTGIRASQPSSIKSPMRGDQRRHDDGASSKTRFYVPPGFGRHRPTAKHRKCPERLHHLRRLRGDNQWQNMATRWRGRCPTTDYADRRPSDLPFLLRHPETGRPHPLVIPAIARFREQRCP